MKQFWKNKSFFNVTRDQCKDTGMALILILLFIIYFFKSEHITIYVIALLILNMVAPWVYRPLAVVWFGFSHLMGTIMSKLILSLIFLVVVTPVGLIRRIFCADTLKLKAFKRDPILSWKTEITPSPSKICSNPIRRMRNDGFFNGLMGIH